MRLLATLLALLCMSVAVHAQNPRPNIVIIMADDMGFSDLGCYGGEIATPNLDRLAADGLRFTQFYNTARCCPTRAALLTGLYPHQAGIGHMTGNDGLPGYIGRLNDQCITLAEALRPVGYTTLISGKWHVGSQPDAWPLKRGFDRFYGIPEGGGNHYTIMPGRHLVIDDKVIEPEPGWYTTDAFSDYAARFIRETPADKPLFLYLPYTAPHWPLQAPPEDIAKYRGKYSGGGGWDKVRRERLERQKQMGIVPADTKLSPRDEQARDWSKLSKAERDEMDLRMAVYAAQVHSMDRGIGRVLDALKQSGREHDTLVMFLSDNGCSAEGGPGGFSRGAPGAVTGTPDSYDSAGLEWANACDTPYRKFKMDTHEGGIITPLIVRWPAAISDRGELRRQVGHVIDLMPTALDVAGVKYPQQRGGKPTIPLAGHSLVPAFNDKPLPREAMFWEHEGNRAVRRGDFKLVASHGGKWSLYNLAEDPTELNDLASIHPEEVAELKQLWQGWADASNVADWSDIQNRRRERGKGKNEK